MGCAAKICIAGAKLQFFTDVVNLFMSNSCGKKQEFIAVVSRILTNYLPSFQN